MTIQFTDVVLGAATTAKKQPQQNGQDADAAGHVFAEDYEALDESVTAPADAPESDQHGEDALRSASESDRAPDDADLIPLVQEVGTEDHQSAKNEDGGSNVIAAKSLRTDTGIEMTDGVASLEHQPDGPLVMSGNVADDATEQALTAASVEQPGGAVDAPARQPNDFPGMMSPRLHSKPTGEPSESIEETQFVSRNDSLAANTRRRADHSLTNGLEPRPATARLDIPRSTEAAAKQGDDAQPKLAGMSSELLDATALQTGSLALRHPMTAPETPTTAPLRPDLGAPETSNPSGDPVLAVPKQAGFEVVEPRNASKGRARQADDVPDLYSTTGRLSALTNILTTLDKTPLVSGPAITASTLQLKSSLQADQAIKDVEAALSDAEAEFSTSTTRLSTSLQTSPTFPARVDMPRHIALQLQEALRGMPDKPVEISLQPEELGKVRMSVSATDAHVVMSVLAERQDTLDLLKRHAEQLSRELAQMGFGSIDLEFGQGTETGADGQEGEATEQSLHLSLEDSTDAEQGVPAHLGLDSSGALDVRI